MMGVDYDLFWTLNPKSLSPFFKAFSLKQQYDDRIAWQSGVYIKMAIASAFNKQAKYPLEPFLQNAKKIEVDPIEQQNEIKQKFLRKMGELNSRFKKEE